MLASLPRWQECFLHAFLNCSARFCAGMLCIGVHTTMDKQGVESCQPDLVRPSITHVSVPDIVGLAKPEADSGAEQACEPAPRCTVPDACCAGLP